MTGSFSKKLLQVNITLAHGTFGAELGNTVVLKNHRVVCTIEKGGHPSKNHARIQVYGMGEDLMTKLSRDTHSPLAFTKKFVQVLAGDDPNNLDIAFQGEVSDSFAAFKSPPHQYLHIEAIEGYYPSLKPSRTRSYQTAIDANVIFSDLASEMGYVLENNGVMAQISTPYLYGSAMDQAGNLAKSLNLEFGVDNGIMFIANKNQPRKGNAPLLTPSTGMKEYPTYAKKILSVESLYIPHLKLGGLFVIQDSKVSNANGTWRITGIKHHLESENPSGPWFTHLKSAPQTNEVGQSQDSGGETSE